MYAPYGQQIGVGDPPYTDPAGFIGFDFFDIFDPTKVAQVAIRAATGNPNITVTSVGYIPVISEAVNIVGGAAAQPFRLVQSIASGERLDKALVANFERDLKLIKEAAPLAQAVISFVPGIGTGVSAALGAGLAIAEGRSIDEVAKAAFRSAIPGGPVAVTAFDTALKVGAGENVGKAALESARALIPDGPARRAFDVGLAVVTGEKLQNALANGLVALAPNQVGALIATGEKAIAQVAPLAQALRKLAPGEAVEGFKLASGLLSQKGINQKALAAVRGRLTPAKRQGFDAALKTQEPQIAWLKNITEAPPVVFIAPMAPRTPTQLDVEREMLAALMVWGKDPNDVKGQQTLLGTAWRWGGVMKGQMKPEDTRLADAITAWSKAPNNAALRKTVVDAGQNWGIKKGAIPPKRVQLKQPGVVPTVAKKTPTVVVAATKPTPAMPPVSVPPSVRGAYAPYPWG